MVDNVNILRYRDKEDDSLLKQLCKDWVDNLAVKFWNHTSLCLKGYGKGSLKKILRRCIAKNKQTWPMGGQGLRSVDQWEDSKLLHSSSINQKFSETSHFFHQTFPTIIRLFNEIQTVIIIIETRCVEILRFGWKGPEWFSFICLEF